MYLTHCFLFLSFAPRRHLGISRAGAAAARFGRKHVLLTAITVMAWGVVGTVSDNAIVALARLVVVTAGFFGVHAIAFGWTAREAKVGKAPASSLHNLSDESPVIFSSTEHARQAQPADNGHDYSPGHGMPNDYARRPDCVS